MKIENLSRFRGKMRFTTVTEIGEITVSIGPNVYRGQITSSYFGYYVCMLESPNYELFNLAKVDTLIFVENVLGYTDDGKGDWPYMKSPDDILKVLVELDRLYPSKTDREEPKSMEEDMLEPFDPDPHPKYSDFIPKKKHYSFNFTV